MNTLSFPQLAALIRRSPAFSSVLEAYGSGSFPLEVEGVEGGLAAFLTAELYGRSSGPFLIVVPTEKEAEAVAADLDLIDAPFLRFPWWGTLPYRDMPPGAAVFGERAAALAALAAFRGDAWGGSAGSGPRRPAAPAPRGGNRGKGLAHGGIAPRAPALVVTERALLTPVPPPEYFRSLLLTVSTKDHVDLPALAAALVAYGYTRVPRVQVHGEFALRGEVLDIFMSADEDAIRIQLDFDEVEAIRRFDPVTQVAKETVSSVTLRPLKELVWTDERIEALRENLAAAEEYASGGAAVLDDLIARRTTGGEELLYPLAFAEPASILDYLDDDATVLFMEYERLANAQESLEREYEGLYRKARREREVPSPSRLLLDFPALAARPDRRVSFMTIAGRPAEGVTRLKLECDPPRSFFGNVTYLKEELGVLVKGGWKVAVFAESDTQAVRIRELLKDLEVSVFALGLSQGFALPDLKLIAIQENEIFGRRKHVPRSVRQARSVAIDTFVELNPGDYVVHVNYGIGLFKGIERIKALGHERDYIQVEYAGEETVFVPIEQANLVQRYIGNEGVPPKLDKLGSKSWESRKAKVRSSVEDIANRLIDLYSKRRAAQGFAFPRDTEWQTAFEAAFPYEETEDQLRCVEEIKDDMESPRPMDRLVCGDVGYGKTEVAVRACFKAVMGGKQVAFLAPTTILAEQHFENFQERFAQFPVRLGMLSRFVDRSEARKTIEAVKKGEIDILVGTHRIIQKDVTFKDLGLLVIDEEQRFGVKDKERLKELKTSVDCLTLSATPIPRTLHMSLLKIRDMSLLATPPYNRHPIETVIDEYNDDRVAAAIRREVERGGQVFYLHNRVESLEEVRRKVERLVPELLVDTAHGQMDPRELEDVMHRFIHGGFHVLVSTTIVENGIDIPNVNTIIIDRADMYGVSQLYQLRGRVGRSDRVAYAYLFYPVGKALSEVAMKRLQVISDFTELGSGFKIAMKDMEIRGAGNLLGREQSGDIFSVGFDLYLRLLDEAVRKLQDENYEAENETYLELEYTGFIPDSYIESAQEKMEVYKKIASIRTRDELEGVYAELVDRFGPLPDEARSLLSLAEIRIICSDLSVSALKEKGGIVRVEFTKVSKVSADRVVRLMKESAGRVKLDPRSPNVLMLQTGAIGLKEKSEFIREKLAALAG